MPPNDRDKQLSVLPPVLFDHAPLGKNFGEVEKNANPSYTRGVSYNCLINVMFCMSVCLCCRNLR